MADTRRRRRNYEEPVETTEEVVNEVIVEENTEVEINEPVEVLEAPVEEEKPKPEKKKKKAKVNVPRLNLRQKPDTGSLILSVLNQDENLIILSETSQFYEVSTEESQIGFVVKEYVTVL